MDALDLLQVTAFRHVIHEPNAEAACERFLALTGTSGDDRTFHDTVARALREGLVRDPIRLLEGAFGFAMATVIEAQKGLAAGAAQPVKGQCLAARHIRHEPGQEHHSRPSALQPMVGDGPRLAAC